MLDLENVNAYYGDSHILHGVSLPVREGEVACLLGRNGAGKTTTILTIMGYLKPRPGRILFRGQDIAALPPFKVARLGFGFLRSIQRQQSEGKILVGLDSARVEGKGGLMLGQSFLVFAQL